MEQKEINKKIAQDYAESKGAKNISDLTADAKSKIRSTNPVERALGLKMAQETIQDLLMLTLKQELMDNPLPGYMNIVERVFDGWMTEGNQKEFVADLDTGFTTYDNSKFIPEKQTAQFVEKYFIQIYTSSASGVQELSPQGYIFQKEQTIPVNVWLPYFLNDKLNEFISFKQDSLNRAFKIFLFNRLAVIITTEGGKVIEGEATNLFDALLELSPEIDNMTLYNSEFNNDQSSKLMYAAQSSNLLIFTSMKVRSLIMNGIKSQLFNPQFVGAESKTYNYDNLKYLGNKISQGDQDTINVDTKEPWINDNTIIVVDISRIKNIIQVENNASQDFAKNLTAYINKNVWGAMDILPWCKKIVYKNANLLVNPTQISA